MGSKKVRNYSNKGVKNIENADSSKTLKSQQMKKQRQDNYTKIDKSPVTNPDSSNSSVHKTFLFVVLALLVATTAVILTNDNLKHFMISEISEETAEFRLPIIDLDKAKVDQQAVAAQVVDALENIGFLYVDNIHGIDFDKLMECCKWFFGQPKEVKESLMRKHWKPENQNVYRGYFPVVEGDPSRKEGFEFGRDIDPNDPNDPTVQTGNWFYEPSVWPKENGSFPFKELLQNYYEILHNASLDVLRLAAVGLGIDEHSFDPIFADRPVTTFRLMHYPPWNDAPPANAKIEDGKIITTPEHSDSNFLTMLYTFHYTGLEVLTADGKWSAPEPRPGSFVMNIGDVFSRMMGGRFKATRHRVLDIGVDRYSVPFFFEPSYDGDIGVNFMSLATGQGPEHKVEKYGPWMIQQVKYIKKVL
ncbi:hypothetical protein DPMN_117411 [Dreissena polymorpha]|uniref:Fe2OG dioxygenase domain-containing protein n=1 Tax=Dreissena polymorpha TaxID=45954 RepID=A0A9D4KPU9_DREPO|nr:hypothetical protein DPMN_117411 [Dreissena polymorpha]